MNTFFIVTAVKTSNLTSSRLIHDGGEIHFAGNIGSVTSPVPMFSLLAECRVFELISKRRRKVPV
jgi:hypothetical protein